jgi:hypothetical protein
MQENILYHISFRLSIYDNFVFHLRFRKTFPGGKYWRYFQLKEIIEVSMPELIKWKP